MSKEVISKVLLKDPDDWKVVGNGELPKGPVVVRLENRGIVWNESDDNHPEDGEWILYGEDIKVAENKNGVWEVVPPYPLYDYSPLACKGSLSKGTTVTHWRPLKDDELKSWQNRLNPINNYQKLKIEVDPEHEENVYRTLVNAAGYIAEVEGDNIYKLKKGQGARLFYETLCDMQAAMDKPNPTEKRPTEIIASALADLSAMHQSLDIVMKESWDTMSDDSRNGCIDLFDYVSARMNDIVLGINKSAEWARDKIKGMGNIKPDDAMPHDENGNTVSRII